METIEEEIEMSTKQDAYEIFELCDQNKKGYLTVEDLKRMTADVDLTDDQIEIIFQQLDTDEDGLITPKEFENGLDLFLAKSQAVPPSNDEDHVSKRRQSTPEETLVFLESPSTEICQYFEGTSQPEFTVLLQSNAAIELWSQIQSEHPELLPIFEEFIQNLASKHQQIREETAILQECFHKKSAAYEQQIRILYEEMESQIKFEKEMILDKKAELEKQLKQELEEAIETKDNDIQELLKNWLQATKQLESISEVKTVTQRENQKLAQEKENLEHQLETYQQQLCDLRQKLDEAKANNIYEKRLRFRSAFQLSEKIAWEREALVKQLNLLRSINERLQDDKSELEDALSYTHAKSIEDIVFLTNEDFCNSTVCTPVQKRGSLMSDYFGIHMAQLPSTSSYPDELNNNDDMTNDLKASSKRIKNTNPFLMDDGSYITVDATSDCYTTINPFIDHGDTFDNASTYASFVEPDFDALPVTHECNLESKVFDNNQDTKSPVLCFVHPNNHQTNGLQFESSFFDAVPHSFEAPKGDTLKKLDGEVEEEEDEEKLAQPSTNTLPNANVSAKTSTEMPTMEQAYISQSIFKVVFIGDSGVGKTSLINRICGGRFSDNFCSTIGVDFRIKTNLIDGHKVILQLWDTAGQERFRSITSQYLRKSDGVLITYDVNSELSFRNVRSWLSSIEEVNNDDVLIVLLGNKLDLVPVNGKKAVSTEEGRNLAADKDAMFFETSAKDGTDVDPLISALARKLHNKQLEEIERCVNLTSNESASLHERKKCC